MLAIVNGYTAAAKAILDEIPKKDLVKVLGKSDENIKKVLIWAAETWHEKTVEAILDAILQDDPTNIFDAVDATQKQSALMLVVKNNQVPIVKVMLEKAKEKGVLQKVLAQKDIYGNTALMLAIDRGNKEIVEAILKETPEVNWADILLFALKSNNS